MSAGWAKVSKAAEYAGVSVRTFRDWIKDGLRYVRLKTGTILVKYDWIDEYLTQYETQGNLVEDIVSSMTGSFA
jgi:excisionase family DNA binding protein